MRSNNLGDALNPVLYRAITGREPEHSEDSPKIMGLGSVAHRAGPGALMWGAGCLSPDMPLQADETTKVCAVRGPLTDVLLRDRGVDVPDLYGDPTLLLPKFLSVARRKTCTVGIVRHYADASISLPLPEGGKLLNVMSADPLGLVAEIAACKMIVSSSLHGTTVAEAYGVPAVWVELSDNVAGGGFKFRDYYLGTGREGTPLNWRDREPDWDKAVEMAERWKPPRFDADEMLAACPYDLEMETVGKAENAGVLKALM